MTNLLAFRRASSVSQSQAEPTPSAPPPAAVVVSTPAPAAPPAAPVAPVVPPVAPVAPPAAPSAPARRWSRFNRSGDDRVNQLRDSTLFAGWSEADVTALAACTDEVLATAGRVIEENVYPYRWWWFVLDGTVAVSTEGEPATVLGPGHSVGLDRPQTSDRRVTLTALDNARLLVGNRQQVIGASDSNRRIHDLVHRSLGRS